VHVAISIVNDVYCVVITLLVFCCTVSLFWFYDFCGPYKQCFFYFLSHTNYDNGYPLVSYGVVFSVVIY